MIEYKKQKFKDYVELFDYMLNIQEAIDEHYFLHSNNFYIRNLLENRFKKSFSIKEIQQLLAEELALGTITLNNEKGMNALRC